MSSFQLTTPVALLVFNRPEATARVFAAIREARPHCLLVVADGPRPGREGDAARCAEVRRLVEQVDWPCEVMKNYAETNLGCKQRVHSGLNWVFSNVQEAILLEDDCLPDPTFFQFCQEMLTLYRHDGRITSICGSNPLGRWKADRQDYHFSLYGGVWGWATWRRAWSLYDVKIARWQEPGARERIRQVLGDGGLFRLRALDFDRVAAGKVDTWDYQWSFAQLMQAGLTVVPATNLISNIGFGANATHTTDSGNAFAALPVLPCRFPIEMNLTVEADREYDAALLDKALPQRPLLLKLSDFVHYAWQGLRRGGVND